MDKASVAATFTSIASNNSNSLSLSNSGFKKFQLEYDEPNRVYNPGEIIKGRLILEIYSSETELELTLEWRGEARVQLSESAGSWNEKHTYLCGSQELISSKSPKELPAGHHEFLFSISLPVDIPSSFKSAHPSASICYKIIANAKKPLFLLDEKIEKEFFVQGSHDLKEHPDCLLPQEISQDSQLSCCLCDFCASKPIGYIVKLEKTGFLPGESFNFVAELFNRSRRSAEVILKFYILERKVFWAQGKSEEVDDRVVAEIPGPKLDSKNREIVQSFTYEIPPINSLDDNAFPYVQPTGLGGCRLITLTYFFKVKMKVPCHNEKSSEIRIHIGTVPMPGHTFPKIPIPRQEVRAVVVEICTSKDPAKSVNLSANSCNY